MLEIYLEPHEYSEDVEFLLSRLQIAEEALKNIEDMIGEEFSDKTKERCQKAIEQIRQ